MSSCALLGRFYPLVFCWLLIIVAGVTSPALRLLPPSLATTAADPSNAVTPPPLLPLKVISSTFRRWERRETRGGEREALTTRLLRQPVRLVTFHIAIPRWVKAPGFALDKKKRRMAGDSATYTMNVIRDGVLDTWVLSRRCMPCVERQPLPQLFIGSRAGWLLSE